MKHIQKLIVAGALVAALGIVSFAADLTATNTATNYDNDFQKKLMDVWFDCRKIQPGMTRADLDKKFRRDTAGLVVLDSEPLSFEEHQTFDYRRCNVIKIDVDFQHSDSKKELPTDVIIKISMPYIDCRRKV